MTPVNQMKLELVTHATLQKNPLVVFEPLSPCLMVIILFLKRRPHFVDIIVICNGRPFTNHVKLSAGSLFSLRLIRFSCALYVKIIIH